MGLSASQARLLTITSRKSDCEFQSMRLSHEKLSISRDLAQISNKYQNSLDKTKLMFDYYGTSEAREQLSYNTLMTPSALNDYMPITITNNEQRVILDSKYASAAKAAGIPQEGLGCVPSTAVREKFINGLCDTEIITKNQAKSILAVPYNQKASLGGSMSEIIELPPTQGTLNDLYEAMYNVEFDFSDLVGDKGGSTLNLQKHAGETNFLGSSRKRYENVNSTTLTLQQLMEGNYRLYGCNWDNEDLRGNNGLYDNSVITKIANGNIWKNLFSSLSEKLYMKGKSEAAFNYAKGKVQEILVNKHDPNSSGYDSSNFAYYEEDKKRSSSTASGKINQKVDNYVGYVVFSNSGDSYNDFIGLNISNVIKSFFTYYAKCMNGFDDNEYDVSKKVTESRFINEDFDKFYFPSGYEISQNDARLSAFYDALLNQICTGGWSENNEIKDNSYLQQMLQNGMMHITALSDDCFYYQKNYATWSYVAEVSDDKEIAKAEAEYKTQKEKLNLKEQKLDLKMKNLDTEITSLTTEYDTVKNLISKSIEKSFKRYNA